MFESTKRINTLGFKTKLGQVVSFAIMAIDNGVIQDHQCP
jgi:hypothetical protein